MNTNTAEPIRQLNEAIHQRQPGDPSPMTEQVWQAVSELSRDDVVDVLDYFVTRADTSMQAWRQRADQCKQGDTA